MSLYAFVVRTRTAGVLSLLLAGVVPVMFAQSGSRKGVIRIDVDGSSYLGVQMEEVTASNMAQYKLSGERGVIVRSVEKGSPAEAAKILENDVIVEYAGMPVLSTMQLARMVRETPVGRKVDIVVSRDGKRINLTAEIGSREEPQGPGGMFRVLPRGGWDRGFEFFGPDGRSFQFRTPEGKEFLFDMPGMEDRFFSFERPRLGVTLEPLTEQMAGFLGVPGRKGLLVTSVEQGAPAAGKLKAGDVIIKADNKNVYSPDDLARIVHDKADGSIDLTVIRDRKEMSIAISLPKQDQNKGTRGYRL